MLEFIVWVAPVSVNAMYEIFVNDSCNIQSGAGENTLRRLALFVYLNHPTKNDVTSGKKER